MQVFAHFAPSELNPMIIRLEAADRIHQLVEKAIAKYQDQQTIVVLPSLDPTEYAVSPAGGDGEVLRSSRPFRPETNVRSCGLEFPYMLTLTHVGEVQTEHPAAESIVNTSAAGKALLSAEKEAVAKHKARVAELREQRVKEIERRQAEKEKKHFQHCESYEVLRRERLQKDEQAKKEAQQRAATLDQGQSLRQEVENERNSAKEQALLEQHRVTKEAKLKADLERQERARELREQQTREVEEKKRAALAELKAKREAEKEQRLQQRFDSLIANLNDSMERDKKEEEERIESERQQRQANERAVLELRRVEHLEKTRAIGKEAQRTKRHGGETAEAEATKLLELTRREALEQKRVADEENYRRWKDERSKHLESVETQLELQYRSQRSVPSDSDRKTQRSH